MLGTNNLFMTNAKAGGALNWLKTDLVRQPKAKAKTKSDYNVPAAVAVVYTLQSCCIV